MDYIGPRMIELCKLLKNMGGESPTRNGLYLRLEYKLGMASNRWGDAVLRRCCEHGLMEETPICGSKQVNLTPKGYEVAKYDED